MKKVIFFLLWIGIFLSPVLSPLYASPSMDGNAGTWTDEFDDLLGVEASSLQNVAINPISGTAELSSGQMSGSQTTVEISPPSSDQWFDVCLDASYSSVENLKIDILNAENDVVIAGFSGLSLNSSSCVDIRNVNFTNYPSIKVRIHHVRTSVSAPVINSVQVSWHPITHVLFGQSSFSEALSGATLPYQIRISVNIVDAKNVVIYSTLPKEGRLIGGQATVVYEDGEEYDAEGRDDSPEFVQASEGGQYADSEVVISEIDGVSLQSPITIPANSVYWTFSSLPFGNSSSLQYFVEIPNGTLDGTKYRNNANLIVENGENKSTTVVETEIRSTPSPQLASEVPTISSSTVSKVYSIDGENYAETGETIRIFLRDPLGAVDGNDYAAEGRERMYNSVVWSDVTELLPYVDGDPSSAIVVHDAVKSSSTIEGKYTSSPIQIGETIIPPNSVYWDLGILNPGDVYQASFSVPLEHGKDGNFTVKSYLGSDQTSVVNDNFDINLGTIPPGACGGSCLAGYFPNRLPQEQDRNCTQFDGGVPIEPGEIVQYRLKLGNCSPPTLEEIVFFDKLPDGVVFQSAGLKSAINGEEQSQARIYYSTSSSTTSPLFDYTNLSSPGVDWTELSSSFPTDPSAVTWIAWHFPKMKTYTGESTDDPTSSVQAYVNVKIPDTGCEPYVLNNEGSSKVYKSSSPGGESKLLNPPIELTYTDKTSVRPRMGDFNVGSDNVFLSNVTVIPGEAEYRLTIKNESSDFGLLGLDTFPDVDFELQLSQIKVNGEDKYPTFLSLEGGIIDEFNPSEGLIKGHLGTSLDPGESEILKMKLSFPIGSKNLSSYKVTATLQGQNEDCTNTNKKSIEKTAIVSGTPVLQGFKDDVLSVIDSGDDITYELYYRNIGNSPSSGTWIVDRIPDKTSFKQAQGIEVWFTDKFPPDLPSDKVSILEPMDSDVITSHFSPGTEISDNGTAGDESDDLWSSPFGSKTTWVAFKVYNPESVSKELFVDVLYKKVRFTVVNDDDGVGPETEGSPQGTFIYNDAAFFSNETLQVVSNQTVTSLQQNPGIKLNKISEEVDFVTSNESFDWTITYSNDSQFTDDVVVITDTLPSTVELLNVFHQWNSEALSNDSSLPSEIQDITDSSSVSVTKDSTTGKTKVNITIASISSALKEDLKSEEGGKVVLKVRPNSLLVSSGTQLINSVRGYSTNQAGTNVASDQDLVSVANADLYTSKIVSNKEPNNGDEVTFSILIANRGSNKAESVKIQDTLPVGFSYVSGSTMILTPGWRIGEPEVSADARTLSWSDLTQLDSFGNPGTTGEVLGSSPDIYLSYKVKVSNVNSGDELVNKVEVSTASPEDLIYPNVDEVKSNVPFPDPSISKTSTPIAQEGDEVVWSIKYNNNNNDKTTNPVYIIDTLPDIDGDGESDVIYSSFNSSEGLTGYYSVESVSTPPAFDPLSPLSNGKWRAFPTQLLGSEVVNHIAWFVGVMDRNASTENISLVTTLKDPKGVSINKGSVFRNTVTIYSDVNDADTSNNTSTSETRVPGVDLSLEKSASSEGGFPGLRPGDEVEYTVKIKNTGTEAAYGLKVEDTLPLNFIPYSSFTNFSVIEAVNIDSSIPVRLLKSDGVPFGEPVFSSLSGTVGPGSKVTWHFGKSDEESDPQYYRNVGLPVGSEVEFTFIGRVSEDAQDGTVLRNTAQVIYDGPIGNTQLEEFTDNNSDTVSTTLYRPDVQVSKSVVNISDGDNEEWADLSDQLRYTVEYDNRGNADADDVIIEDEIPVGTCFKVGSVVPPSGSVAEYSSDGGFTWSYSPVSQSSQGEDCNVTHVRIRFLASLPAPGNYDGLKFDPINCEGTVACYQFEDNTPQYIFDSSGNNYHGLIEGLTQQVKSGVIGDAAELYKSLENVIHLGKPSKIKEHTGSTSISFWVFVPDTESEKKIDIVLVQDDLFILGLTTDYKVFASIPGSEGKTYPFKTAQKVPFDQWVHITMVYDQSEPKASIYVDGVLSAIDYYGDFLGDSSLLLPSPPASRYQNPNTNMFFGNDSVRAGGTNQGIGDEGNFLGGGKLDEVRIYNHALSKEQIRSLYLGRFNNTAIRSPNGQNCLTLAKPEFFKKHIQTITPGKGGLPAGYLGGDMQQLGASVTTIHDYHGNGIDDIVVSVPHHANSSPDLLGGEILIIDVDENGKVTNPGKIKRIKAKDIIEGVGDSPDGNRDYVGIQVTLIDDLDQNGYKDLAVGRRWKEIRADSYTGPNDYGEVFIVFFNDTGDGIKGYEKLELKTPDPTFKYLNGSVAVLEDRNGDGIKDLLVGAFRDGSTDTYGAVFILEGIDKDGMVTKSTKITLTDLGISTVSNEDWNEQGFGYSITELDDLDGNGVREFFVGSPRKFSHYVIFFNADGSFKKSQELAWGKGGLSNSRFWSFLSTFWAHPTYHLSYPPRGQFKLVDDFDGNGFRDVVVSSYYQRGFTTISLGKDGKAVSYKIVEPGISGVPEDFFVGDVLTQLKDFDGNGIKEIFTGEKRYDASTGALHLISLSSPSEYLTSGTYETLLFSTPTLSSWGKLLVKELLPTGTKLEYEVYGVSSYDETTGAHTCNTTALLGPVSAGNGFVDLSSIGVEHDKLCLKVHLSTTDIDATPELCAYRATFLKEEQPSFIFDVVVKDPDISGQTKSIDNTVVISTSTPEISDENNESSDSINLRLTDLELSKFVDKAAIIGSDNEQIVYTLKWRVLGPQEATNVEIKDVLPNHVSFVSSIPSVTKQETEGSGSEARTVLFFDLGTKGIGASGEIKITVQETDASTGDALMNVSSISTDRLETDYSNNKSTVVSIVGNLANVWIDKEWVNPSTGVPMLEVTDDGDYEYIIEYGNNGNVLAENVSIKDTFPFPDLVFKGLKDNTGAVIDTSSYVQNGEGFTISLGDLSVGEKKTLRVVFSLGTNTSSLLSKKHVNVAEINTDTDEVSLSDNRDDHSLSVQLLSLSSISGKVWHDKNRDGEIDEYETGIEGVLLTLKGVDNINNASVTMSVKTDSNGDYSFSGLYPGNYTLEETQPLGWLSTSANLGDIRDNASPPSVLEGQQGNKASNDRVTNIVLNIGNRGVNYDFGEDLGSIGDLVWLDENANGVFDSGENGIPGIELLLYRDTDRNGTLNEEVDSFLFPSVTDSEGNYLFEDLPLFDASNNSIFYIVKVVSSSEILEDYVNVKKGNSRNELGHSVELSPSNDGELTVDFGYARKSTVGDYVWYDENKNGIQDPGESGIAGAVVELFDSGGKRVDSVRTDGSGKYLFSSLLPGNYRIKFSHQNSAFSLSPLNSVSDTSFDSDADPNNEGYTKFFTLSENMSDLTIDAGMYVEGKSLSSVGDRVWLDDNGDGLQSFGESGVPGVQVEIRDVSNPSFVISTAFTDASGNYLFAGLYPSTYMLKFTPPSSSYSFVSKNVGGDLRVDSDAEPSGLVPSVTLSSGENNLDIDAGLKTSSAVSKLGDRVWYDVDGDGVQDEHEPGLSGVVVELYKKSGSEYSYFLSTRTDSNGNYLFSNLLSGDYYIKVLPPGQYKLTKYQSGVDSNKDSDVLEVLNRSSAFHVSAGEDDLSIDAGLVLPVGVEPSFLGDYVWHDEDKNGVQNLGEFGVSGVEVTLFDEFGVVVDGVFTDGSGNYSFSFLSPGKYTVGFLHNDSKFALTTPDVNSNSNDELDSDVNVSTNRTSEIVLSSGQSNLSVDAGLYLKDDSSTSSIGDYAWHDEDEDGVQDAGELGLPGVLVKLEKVSDPLFSSFSTTDASGRYEFRGLFSGAYRVRFTTLSGYIFTVKDIGGDDALDSDAEKTTGLTSTIDLSPGVFDKSIDSGFTTSESVYSLGNFIWHDSNKDGLQSDGELGVASVLVTLYKSVQGQFVVFSKAYTDSKGHYEFSNLLPGDYSLSIEPPIFYDYTVAPSVPDPSKDSDIVSGGSGVTSSISLTSSNLDIDVGLVLSSSSQELSSSLGGVVWYDSDKDGVRDSNEEGLSGVVVSLFRWGESRVLSTKSTDSTGRYSFTPLPSGSYYIEVSPPGSETLSPLDQGSNDAVDSDVSPSTRRTSRIELGVGVNKSDVDAGMYVDGVELGSVGNFVWHDVNGDGEQSLGEEGLSGVLVKLLDGAGNSVSEVSTDSQGGYTFEGLLSSDYKSYQVEFVLSSSYLFTKYQASGVNSSKNSDANEVSGKTEKFSLSFGESRDDLDAGLLLLKGSSSVSGRAWFDLDKDGLQDFGEQGISGVKVKLFRSSTNKLMGEGVTTDGLGNYEFLSLPLGSYYLEFEFSDSFKLSPKDEGDDELDSDVDATNRANITLGNKEHNDSTDIGLFVEGDSVTPSSLGDYVWYDENGDSLQSVQESGVPGIVVELLNEKEERISQIRTDSEGSYVFEGLLPGSYKLRFNPPSGFELVKPDVGENEFLDSDALLPTGLTSLIDLSTPSFREDLDAGLSVSGSDVSVLEGRVWYDENSNGVQDVGELGVPSVLIKLYDGSNALFSKAYTDSEGLYSFPNLLSGNYHIEVVFPVLYNITLLGEGGDEQKDSDVDPTTRRSQVVTVSPGVVSRVDAGLILSGGTLPSSLGDYVWEDVDRDGLQDTVEGGIGGVLVELYDSIGVVISRSFTDSSGLYEFVNLSPGDYYVGFNLSSDLAFTKEGDGSSSLEDSDADPKSGLSSRVELSSGENDRSIDAGFVNKLSVGDYVWYDENKNGIQEPGESGIAGAVVELFDSGGERVDSVRTDDSGKYLFSSLLPGNYRIKFSHQNSAFSLSPLNAVSDTSFDSDADPKDGGYTKVFTLGESISDLTIDAGMYVEGKSLSSVGDRVWRDENGDGLQSFGELGVPGVRVEILDVSNPSLVMSTAFTDASGNYLFEGLYPSTYMLKFTPPSSSYSFVSKNVGGDLSLDSDADSSGLVSSVTLSSGENNLDIDAGLKTSVEVSKLGDRVWYDVDGDGVQDEHEPGLSGVLVELYKESGPVYTYFASTRTDSNGNYLFSNLLSGNYYIKVLPPGQYKLTKYQSGVDSNKDSDVLEVLNRSSAFHVSAGEDDLSIDAGLVLPVGVEPSFLGDYVWHDEDKNGVQNLGEFGVSGVEVTLFDEFGVVVDGVFTDGSGNYSFSFLSPGKYTVGFLHNDSKFALTTPDVNSNSNDELDSDVNVSTNRTSEIVLSSGQSNLSVDAGLYLKDDSSTSSIGDYAWHDEDEDGVQDAGELGLPGVLVKLEKVSDPLFSSFSTTDASGRYEFRGLFSGAYRVRFTTLSGYIFTVKDIGGDDALDSDAEKTTGLTSTIDLSPGVFDKSIDSGFTTSESVYSLGNFIWHDSNKDGLQSDGELGVASVLVTLYKSVQGQFVVFSKAYTDSKGHYEFSNLLPGDYSLSIEPPIFYDYTVAPSVPDPSKDSDIVSGGSGVTSSISLTSSNLDIDVGLVLSSSSQELSSSLGGVVWYDSDKDGVRDSNEEGLSGVVVSLFRWGESRVLSTKSTDSTGRYSFTPLPSGSYYIEVSPPGSETLSPLDQGSNDAVDSDVSPSTRRTSRIELGVGVNKSDVDAGMYVDGVELGSVGNFVWHDVNGDGEQSLGEEGLSGVLVKLLDGAGNSVSEVSTDSQGGYTFEGLLSSDYKSYQVEFVLSSSYLFTKYQASGVNSSKNSDANEVSGKTEKFSLSFGESRDDLDAGLLLLKGSSSVSGRAWFDLDKDGLQDFGEQGISGVKVKLFRSSTNKLMGEGVTTDGLGNYEFLSLPLGSYYLEFEFSDSFKLSPKDEGDDELDSDVDATNRANITLGNKEHNDSTDIGLFVEGDSVTPSSLGDYVWYDENGDSLQSVQESGVPGIVVELLNEKEERISQIRTDSEGSYVFEGLLPGSYKLRFNPPSGFELVKPDVGENEFLDSDALLPTGLTSLIDLSTPSFREDLDAGLSVSGSDVSVLEGRVWYDENSNGVQDVGELGVPSVLIKLYDGSNALFSKAYTDSEGLYSFPNLLSGNYHIEVVFPVLYNITLLGEGGDEQKDSDVDPTTRRSQVVTVSPGVVSRVDAGLILSGGTLPSSLGDYVWEDVDRDGLQDTVEGGIGGVLVELYDSIGVVISRSFTDSSGLYEFVNLSPGDYYVGFNLSSDLAFTKEGDGSSSLEDSDADPKSGLSSRVELSSGENDRSIDAGFVNKLSVGDYVWYDENKNGIQEPGESGIAGAVVELFDSGGERVDSVRTDDSGKYLFSSLLPGNYRIKFSHQNSAFSLSPLNAVSDTSFDSDADPKDGGYTKVFTLGESISDLTIDAGMYVEGKSLSSVGDRVWRDENGDGLQSFGELGVPGVRVEILDVSNPSLVMSTAFTDASGNYLFEGLYPSTYMLKFTPPSSSYSFVSKNVGGDLSLDSDADSSGLVSSVTLSSGENNLDIDAGLKTSVEVSKLGDRVWYDVDGDGVQDEHEPGLSGVLVELYKESGPVYTYFASTRTDSNGNYLFSNLLSGNYYIKVLPPGQYKLTKYQSGVDSNKDSDVLEVLNRSSAFHVSAGEDDLSIDAGLVLPVGVEPSFLGDYVWHDEDKNGVQNLGEFGVSGVEVTLFDEFGVVVDGVFTDGSGNYSFSFLSPGKYTVGFLHNDSKFALTTPDVNSNSNDELDSDVNVSTNRTSEIVLSSGQSNLSVDAGLYLKDDSSTSSIGDYAWHDEDEDGVQDAGELGLPGVLVKLEKVSDPLFSSFSTTDASGRYEFRGLFSGAYRVRFTTLSGYIFTVKDIGGDDALDSDAEKTTGLTSTIDLSPGVFDKSIDSGFTTSESVYSLGNFIWHDSNKDGLQSDGELGVASVLVTLYKSVQGQFVVFSKAYTDSKGHYEFSNLLPGDYSLSIELPIFYDYTVAPSVPNPSKDSDIVSGGSGVTSSISLTSSNLDIDVGLVLSSGSQELSSSLGGVVWYDSDKDGVRDSNEEGLSGIVVSLFRWGESRVLSTKSTDSTGHYKFRSLPSGSYYIEVSPPGSETLSPLDQGNDDAVDSDVSPSTRRTSRIELGVGVNKSDVDAGMYVDGVELGSVGNFVWHDVNGDGEQSLGEEGLSGVLVKLLDGAGNSVSEVSTDSQGGYTFEGLLSSDYKSYQVEFVLPSGYLFTEYQASGVDSSKNSDANEVSGKTEKLSLSVGESRDDLDAGLLSGPGSNVLRSPFYVIWNGFLEQMDIVSLFNISDDQRSSVSVTLINMFGETLSSKDFTLDPRSRFDIAVNLFENFDFTGYGIVKVEFSPEKIIDGFSGLYRFSSETGDVEFAVLKKYANTLYGTSYVSANTYQPSRALDELNYSVIHWLQMSNYHLTRPINFKIVYYDIRGKVFDENQIEILPLNRRDIQGGHEYLLSRPQEVSLIEIIPDDSTIPYGAELFRYGGDSNPGTFPSHYSFGLSEDARLGDSLDKSVFISTMAGGDPYVELYNVSDDLDVLEFEVLDYLGKSVFALSVEIPSRGQHHFPLHEILDSQGVVVARSLGSKNFFLKCSTYYREPNGRISAANMSHGVSISNFSNRSTSTHNTFLGQYNWLRMFNFHSESVDVTVQALSQDGEVMGTSFIKLPSMHGQDLDLNVQMGLPKDQYGQVRVISSVPGVLMSEVYKTKYSNEYPFLHPNTFVDFAKGLYSR